MHKRQNHSHPRKRMAFLLPFTKSIKYVVLCSEIEDLHNTNINLNQGATI